MSGRRNPRRHGDLIEIKFILKAFENGLLISKPLSDTLPYDLVADYYGELSRVQVKSTSKETGYGEWRVLSAHGANKRPYTADEIDFVVVYITPLDIWYLIPIDEIDGIYVYLYPEIPNKDQFGKFKENWELIKPPRKYIVAKASKRKIIGGIYKTNYGYQVRFGRKITKHFKDKKEAETCLQSFREQHNQDNYNSD